MKDLEHWANNCAGIVLVSVLFIVVTLAAGRFSGTGTGTLVTLFSLIGLAALGAWAWIAFSRGAATADKIARPR